jgi:Peptidase family M28/PDZ domain/PA domain
MRTPHVIRHLTIPRRCFAIMLGILLALAPALAADDTVQERMKKDLFFLASDECQGRGIDTPGINKAADYIINELKQAGLKPGGKDGTFAQPFAVNQGDGEVKGVNTLTLHGPGGKTIDLKMDEDFKVLPLSASAKVSAPVVFLGYGLSVPHPNYDDFKGVDVAGKVVVILRRVPRWDDKAAPFGGNREAYAGYERKIGNCEVNRAAAVILVNDQSEIAEGDKFMDGKGALAVSVPVIQLKRGQLDMLLTSGNKTTLANLEREIDRDLQPRSGPISGWSATITTTLERTSYQCKNIIGVLPGFGPLANETVVVGAHYDHLGFGGQGSLAKDRTKKEIHHGADDNASGTTTVVEIARHFAAMKERHGRRLVFILFSGEERGLLGSKYYCNKEPLFPLESTVAMVNLDMVGRLKDTEPKLWIGGVGTGAGLEPLVDKLAGEFAFETKPTKSGYGPSDHDSFYRKKVPVLFLFTGYHEDYHRPTDTADKINFPSMVKIAAFTEKLVAQLGTQPQRPEYVHIAAPIEKGGGPPGAKMRLIPDYGDDSNKGMLIESVVENGPAAKAGIKPGDRLIAIKALPTPNVNAYMTAMQQQKAGVPMEVTVLRSGKEMKLTVTPE